MENEPKPEENPSRKISDVLSRYGEDYGFDTETREEIAEMEFPDAFEAAYGYLTQAGLDADEILAPFMEEPAEE